MPTDWLPMWVAPKPPEYGTFPTTSLLAHEPSYMLVSTVTSTGGGQGCCSCPLPCPETTAASPCRGAGHKRVSISKYFKRNAAPPCLAVGAGTSASNAKRHTRMTTTPALRNAIALPPCGQAQAGNKATNNILVNSAALSP